MDPSVKLGSSSAGTLLTVVDKLLQRHLLMSPDFKQPLAVCMIMPPGQLDISWHFFFSAIKMRTPVIFDGLCVLRYTVIIILEY
jgi:hypothetical protein